MQPPLNRDVIIQEKTLFIIKHKDNYHFPLYILILEKDTSRYINEISD